MKWFIAFAFCAPMAAAAAMGPDLWFKFSFFAGSVLILALILTPSDKIVQDDPDVDRAMPPFMTADQVLRFVDRQDRTA